MNRLRLMQMMAGVLAAALLVSVACDDWTRSRRDPFNPRPGAPSFNIGKPEQYRTHGLYDRYLDSYGALLVSRPASGSTMLVALDMHCPYDGRRVTYDEMTNRIHCGNCGSRWTTDGVIQSGSLCEDSLPRFRIRLAGSGPSDQRDLVVDTSRIYRQSFTRVIGGKEVELQEWSATDSMYHFEIDPRHRDLKDKVQVD